jgi:hypothetical protein
VLEEQCIGVPLLEGVCSLDEALGLEQTVTIDGTECHVLLPVRGLVRGRWRMHLVGLAAPSSDHEQNPGWLKSIDWGDPYPGAVAIIRAVGITPVGTTIPPGDQHIAFDRAVAQWRHLLRDWLAVAAEGPTDFPDMDYYGATIWGSSEYDDEEILYQPPQSGHRHRPQRLSAWAWSHAIEHASAGDQPPLARALMTKATRAAVTAKWRVAIIDAATATEIALTTGLTARLSATLSPRDVKKRLDSYRMLGRRIELAEAEGMVLPDKIRKDLVDRRNDVVHQGIPMTSADAKAAISAAWKVVRGYDSLPACCREPAGHDENRSTRPTLGAY